MCSPPQSLGISLTTSFSSFLVLLMYPPIHEPVLTGTGSENEFSSYAKLILFHETLKGHKYIMEKVLSVMNIAVKC